MTWEQKIRPEKDTESRAQYVGEGDASEHASEQAAGNEDLGHLDRVWSRNGSNRFPHQPSQVDEKPVDWRPLVQPIPTADSFGSISCEFGALPKDPEPVPSMGGKHPSHHQRGRDPSQIGMPQVERRRYWSAISEAAGRTQRSHDHAATLVESFHHAERDPELRALLFMLPGNNMDWHGRADELANTQQVPGRGGPTVGSLFDHKNEVALSRHDRAAIDATAKANQNGQGNRRIETAAGPTIKSDTELPAAVTRVSAALDEYNRASTDIVKEINNASAFRAGDDAAEAQADIEHLKQDAENAREVVEGIGHYITMVAHFAKGDIGDGIDQLFTMAGMLVSHINDGKIAAAEQRLNKTHATMRSAQGRAVAAALAASKFAASSKLKGISIAKAGLLQALTTRRQAYNRLGEAAERGLDCPDQSRKKIAAILSAIPIVETIAARARAIRLTCAHVVKYTDDAARGFGMAMYSHDPNCGRFLTALGKMGDGVARYGFLEHNWQARLDNLVEIKSKIIGARPGD